MCGKGQAASARGNNTLYANMIGTQSLLYGTEDDAATGGNVASSGFPSSIMSSGANYDREREMMAGRGAKIGGGKGGAVARSSKGSSAPSSLSPPLANAKKQPLTEPPN